MSKHKAALAVTNPTDEIARQEMLPSVAPPAQSRTLTLDLSVQDLLRQKKAIADMLDQVLKPDLHYGASFPGDTKKNLLQPGADALLVAFGLVPRYAHSREDIAVSGEGMHREYTVTTTLFTRSGQEVGSGIGSCSTMESKYRWRNDKRVCPQCGKDTIIKGKAEYGGGWLCFTKKDGCGAKWPAGAKEIEGQIVGKVPNPDIADTYNTVLKIATKRSKVAATIAVTGCSDMFTQDVEDLVSKIDDDSASPASQSAAAPRQAPAAAQQPTAAPAAARPAPAPAPAPAAPANDDAKLDADISEAYQRLIAAASKPIASKVWARWQAKDKKAERYDAIRRFLAAFATIHQRLGGKAERLIADLTFDRSDPENVDGMLADLEKAAGTVGADQPPY